MKHAILSLIFAAAALQPAWADRAPTPPERARIEATLLVAGFQRWNRDIELDDGRWVVDDAVFADGRQFDLKLDPVTLVIVDSERD
jgi:Peptidase propeptide and YPEB domain